MVLMKAKELRDLSNEELDKRLNEAKTEFFNLRVQLATGHLDNPMRIRELKKDIARIFTVKNERASKGE